MAKEYKSIKDIAADIRAELKAQLPEWKFSVRVQTYSGGGSINMSLMSGPEQVVVPVWGRSGGYSQLNQYTFLNPQAGGRDKLTSNGTELTPKGWEVMKQATEILSAPHWDESNSQIDYFCCNYYMHIEIGQWDKPYTVR
jgi:hypothetical protein